MVVVVQFLPFLHIFSEAVVAIKMDLLLAQTYGIPRANIHPFSGQVFASILGSTETQVLDFYRARNKDLPENGSDHSR
jgi:hypothetical protein